MSPPPPDTRAGPPGQNDDERTIVGGASVNAGSALPFGHKLQEYVIEGLIGEGGFGIVYLARDTRLGRNVALKEYMPANLATRSDNHTVSVRSERYRETFEMGLRSFVNEAQLLASFDHPSLVKVYRFWEENGTAYMVMPYYQGPTLKKWLGELGKPPDERWLMALLAPMIDALQQLHHDHCYHRDIAPDNILLLPLQGTQADASAITVRPLLLDFGAARRVIGDMTHALTVILKPGYAPIEQYADSVAMKQGPWTDVYALCAVLYACVTGRAPTPSVSRMMSDDMVPAVEAGVGRYSPPFLEAIDAGLAVRPEARPQSMEALRELFSTTWHGQVGLESLLAHAAPAPAHIAAAPAARTPAPARIDPVLVASPASDQTIAVPPPYQPARVQPVVTRPASSTRGLRLALPLLAALVLAGGGWWWYANQSGRKTSPPVALTPAASAVAVAPPASAVQAATPAVQPAQPAVVEPVAFSVLAALQDIVDRGDPQLIVNATSDKSSLTIGKDLMKFRVKSSESGYLYIFFGGTDKQHFHLLFPNALDNNNRIEAGRELVLPRPAWEITASGPPGTNHVVALVSRRERDLRDAGLVRSADATPEFDLAEAQRRWAQRQAAVPGAASISPFVGKARCDAAPCDETYGATLFEINEVAAPGRARK